MIPADVNVSEISSSLSDATSFIDPNFPLGASTSTGTVVEKLDAATEGKSHLGTVKTVMLNRPDLDRPTTRDVAQAIKDETGATTVILYTPSHSAVVSDVASRFDIETHSSLLPNPAAALAGSASSGDGAGSEAGVAGQDASGVQEMVAQQQQFIDTLGATQPPVALSNGLVGLGLVVAVTVTAVSAVAVRRLGLHP